VSKKAIVFIDGNNFYHNIKKTGVRPGSVNLYRVCQLITDTFGVEFTKSIYYNSIPDIRDGEKMYYGHLSYLSEVARLPNFEVKTRKLQKQSVREFQEEKQRMLSALDFCEKCRPLAEKNCFGCVGTHKKKEKGIDVMIAVDMVENAIENRYDCFVLISGDADFIPALELVRKRGKRIFSASLEPGYSINLTKKFPSLILTKELIEENCLKQ
ncbi:MAG: NYN domain-containing protein, partial [Candidatus Micrarchaeota archaeon]